jgi:hypothetical protein
MKSVFTRSAVGRRAATGTVLALTAATLSLGLAGPASAANTIELQGTVTGVGGAALENVDVTAIDAAGNPLETDQTDAAGHYQFDDDVVVGAVKVEFDPSGIDPVLSLTSSLPYQVRYSGGSRYLAGASVSNIASADPAAPATVNVNLPQYAAINGNIRVGADGHVATDGNFVLVYDADDNSLFNQFINGGHQPQYDEFFNPATGDYRVVVDPSTPLRVEAFGGDTNVTYLSQFWKDADTLAAATPVNVTPGQTVGGINFRLSNSLTARQAPQIMGYPTIGLPLTSTPGTWSRNAGTEFSYKWMRGATVVGTGATYVPTVADFGQKLTLVVTALNGENTGQSSTVTTDVVKYGATEKVRAKAKDGRKVALAIKLVSAKQSPVKGKVVVMRGTKRVHKAVKLVKGKAVIVLKHQPKGKQAYTVHYKGNSTLAQVDKTVTVRVHN